MQQNAKAALKQYFSPLGISFFFLHNPRFSFYYCRCRNLQHHKPAILGKWREKGARFSVIVFARVDFFCQQSDLDCL